MSTPRFHVTSLVHEGELSSDQAHHARDVLRLHDSQEVVVFNGEGRWAPAKLTVQKKHVSYLLTGEINQDPPPRYPLSIATAVPKGDRANFLLEQISQLGVATLTWLDCRYSVVHPVADKAKMDKWNRLAIESAKQCGRSRVLSIATPLTPKQILAAGKKNTVVIWTHTGATETLNQRLTTLLKGRHDVLWSGVIIMIGPEGGWSDEELEFLMESSPPVRLGNHILRIETAATTAAAIAQTMLA